VNYRVAVVGAGPGGALLARELARSGIEVTIFEKNSYEELGHDWSDAVEIAALEAAGLDMPILEGLQWKGSLVKNTLGGEGIFEKHAVPRLTVYSPGKKSRKEIEFRMITTDRRRLGQMLIKQAEEAGAVIKYQHEGKGLLFRENGKKGPDGVEISGFLVHNLKTGIKEKIEADVVVESSGFESVLRKSLPAYSGLADPFRKGDFALVHREVRPYKPADPQNGSIPDHYRYGYHSGYQWTHIHNEESIDVGAGVRSDLPGDDPQEIIEAFIAEHPAIKPGRIRGGRSLCIVGRPLTNFTACGFVVLGDAASTSVPTTGCGVGSAIFAGLWASEVLLEASLEKRKDLDKLWAINKKFYLDNYRGASFTALSELRVTLQTLSHKELDFLYSKNLLDAETLQDAINGHFSPPGFIKKLKALQGGLINPPILFKLNRAVGSAARVYGHCMNYPPYWDAAAYKSWKESAFDLRIQRDFLY